MGASKNLSLSKINDVILGAFDYEICKNRFLETPLLYYIFRQKKRTLLNFKKFSCESGLTVILYKFSL
jgi:hypothetical protein